MGRFVEHVVCGSGVVAACGVELDEVVAEEGVGGLAHAQDSRVDCFSR